MIIEPNKRISWDEYFSHEFFLIPKNEEKELQLKRVRRRESTIRKDIIGFDNIGKNGKMSVTYDNGDRYEGDFVDNILEGNGKYVYGNGDI